MPSVGQMGLKDLGDNPYLKRKLSMQSTKTERLLIGLLVAILIFTTTYRFLSWRRELITLPEPKIIKYKQNTPCKNLAKETDEPYTSEYTFRSQGVDVNGEMWADYNWPGNISYDDFHHPLVRDPLAYHRFKIFNNRLYHTRNPAGYRIVPAERQTKIINSLLMTLAWFKVPDVDFVMDLEDHQQHGDGAQICFAMFNRKPNPKGFTAPSTTAFFESLGPHQMKTYQECLKRQHTRGADRIPKAVWRGTWWRGHYKEAPRPRLVRLAATASNITDIKIIRVMKCNSQFCLSGIPEEISYPVFNPPDVIPEEYCPGEDMDSEDYNDYALVVDLDGIGFSGRLGELLMSNTPVLKQNTQFPEYFWRDMVRKNITILFSQDLSDFLPIVSKELETMRLQPSEYLDSHITRMHEFAQTHLSHFGVARATAYALTVYANKLTWAPKMEESFFEVKADWSVMPNLPVEFKERMRKSSETQTV